MSVLTRDDLLPGMYLRNLADGSIGIVRSCMDLGPSLLRKHASDIDKKRSLLEQLIPCDESSVSVELDESVEKKQHALWKLKDAEFYYKWENPKK